MLTYGQFVKLLWLKWGRPYCSSKPAFVMVDGLPQWVDRPPRPEYNFLHPCASDDGSYVVYRYTFGTWEREWPEVPVEVFKRAVKNGVLVCQGQRYVINHEALPRFARLPPRLSQPYRPVLSKYRRDLERRAERDRRWQEIWERARQDPVVPPARLHRKPPRYRPKHYARAQQAQSWRRELKEDDGVYQYDGPGDFCGRGDRGRTGAAL